MQLTALLATALLSASTVIATPSANISPLIVGGKETPTNSSQFTTGLRDTATGSSYCGGSLIHPKWVLSAAHCRASAFVNVGTHFISGSSDGQIVKVLRKISHPSFSSVVSGWDYALLELEQEVTAFAPVKLAKADGSDEPVGTIATALGWGKTSDFGSNSKVLLQVDLPIVTKAYCQQKLTQWATISDTMLCAGAETSKDACGGDSGGPLVVKDANGTAVLVGVTSWGKLCGTPGRPGVYARVSAGRAFIDLYVPSVEWV